MKNVGHNHIRLPIDAANATRRFRRISRFAAGVASAFVLTALAAVAPAQDNVWKSHGPVNVGWINDLTIADSVAYAATLNGVFRSDDGAASWQESGLEGQSIAQIVSAPGAGFVLAMTPGAVYISRDAGETWVPVAGLPPSLVLIAIDPRPPATAYAVGGVDGAIWKSTDAGSSWQRLSGTPGQPSAFAFDSHAMYVRAFDPVDNVYKLSRSSDGGGTWTPVSSPVPYPTAIAGSTATGFVYTGGVGSFCRSGDSAATWSCSSFPQYAFRIVEVPGEPGSAPHILAVSEGGVYVSRDGGATWAHADGEIRTAGYATALASDGSGSLALAGTQTQVFRSSDRGISWTRASAGLHSSMVTALAIDPHDPLTVWTALYGFAGLPKSPGLFRSADAGLSWAPGDGPSSSSPLSALAIGPGHPSTLYAGGSAVYRSDDDGEHWTSSPLPAAGGVSSLAIDPGSPDRVWAIASGGLFRSDDGARSWTSDRVVAQDIYCLLFDARHPGTMYAGSYLDIAAGYYPEPQGGSIFVSRDSGANWAQMQRGFESAVLAIASDPFRDGVLYVGMYAGLVRYDGAIWRDASSGLSQTTIRKLIADPVRPGRLYAVTDGGVYRTIDGAQTWQPFSSGLGSLPVQSLVISPDGRWLYAGTIGGGVFELDLEVRDRRILPVVGSTPGVNGAFFRTSVQLHNPGSSSMAGRIVFHSSGVAGSENDPALSYSLAPGQTQSIADLLPAMSRAGLGSADIEITTGEVPVATARVFNDAGASGTTGFTEQAMRTEEALQSGQTGVLLIPPDLSAARFNVGVRTLDDGASLTFTLKNAAGTSVGSTSRVFPPNYHEQQDGARFLGGAMPAGGSISITVSSGAAIIYGATVDNRTGDPSLQIANVSP